MELPTLKDLLDAGVHFGHQASRWNPKMRPFIFGEREGVHIIDLEKSHAELVRACEFVQEIVRKNGVVLFVGTKRQAQAVVQQAAEKCGMPYVTFRWIGGLLTNFDTIRLCLRRLRELSEKKQTEEWGLLTKREISDQEKELLRLEESLGGVRELKKLPEALFVVDLNKDLTAVREANRLKIPVIALADTNTDPDLATIPIPSNDDAIRAIQIMVQTISEAIEEVGKTVKARKKEESEQEEVKVGEEIIETAEDIEEEILAEEKEEEDKKRQIRAGRDREI
jgi:small subunit ribosomal protein S2